MSRRRKNSSVNIAREDLAALKNGNGNAGMANSHSRSDYNSMMFIEFVKRKLPAISSLIVGVLVGLLFAQSFSRDPAPTQQWKGSGAQGLQWAATGGHRPGGRHSSYVPTLEQRFRVFEVLSTLTGYHTRQCTVNSQPAYRRQVYERYERLIGYEHTHQRPSLLGRLFGGGKSNGDGIPTTSLSKRSSSSSQTRLARHGRGKTQHKYFFAINLYNSFDIIPDLFSTMFKVSSIVGFHNVFVSVYENGSTDQTKALLRLFDALSRSVGLRVVIRTSLRTRGAFHHRIEYLAEVRNAALAPLQELRDAEGEVFDSVIFMNDVLPCVDDLLELIWQSRLQNAGITCGADYIFHEEVGSAVFYDNWVARDMNGTALENAPFEAVFRDPESSHRFQRHLPIQVQSCWNGIAILDPAPMYAHPHVRFRMARLGEGECSASECSLICNDYWQAGYGRIVTVPRVKLAYDKQVFDIIHPARRNLTVIRAYSRLGGHPDDPQSDPQDRSWFGPHDRLFRQEESEPINFKMPPPYVWCWGWDGAGDIEGPDVEPVWEALKNSTGDPRTVRHDRGFEL